MAPASPFELRVGWVVGQLWGVLMGDNTRNIFLIKVQEKMTLLSHNLPAVRPSDIIENITRVKWVNSMQIGIFNAEIFAGEEKQKHW